MKNKKLLLLPIAILFLSSAQGQMLGPDAYLKGTGVEIGINGLGGYEGVDQATSPALPGMHFRSNNPIFGFVANPQNDGWVNFDGDFFSPGSPENGWGFQLDTMMKSNNSTNQTGWDPPQILGAITSWTHVAPLYTVDWDGDFINGVTNLHFHIKYELNELDLFYVTTVTVTNNTSDTIPELIYYRNLDPDNNVSLTGDYTTQNTILSQPFGGGTYASVSGEQTTPWASYFAFVTEADPNWRAGYGGFTNRIASDMWNGGTTVTGFFTQTVGATNFADEAIYVSYKVQHLIPAGSETFKFCSTFDEGSADCAIAAMRLSHALIPSVNTLSPAFTLSGGSPSGGTYSGTGVVGGTTFDPAISGAGDFPLTYAYTDTNACTSFATVNVHVDIAMGIEENVWVNTVVYPNPVTDEATLIIPEHVKLTNAQLSIVDVLGKEVANVSDISSNRIKVDRTGLSNGVYFYKLLNDNKIISSGKIMLK